MSYGLVTADWEINVFNSYYPGKSRLLFILRHFCLDCNKGTPDRWFAAFPKKEDNLTWNEGEREEHPMTIYARELFKEGCLSDISSYIGKKEKKASIADSLSETWNKCLFCGNLLPKTCFCGCHSKAHQGTAFLAQLFASPVLGSLSQLLIFEVLSEKQHSWYDIGYGMLLTSIKYRELTLLLLINSKEPPKTKKIYKPQNGFAYSFDAFEFHKANLRKDFAFTIFHSKDLKLSTTKHMRLEEWFGCKHEKEAFHKRAFRSREPVLADEKPPSLLVLSRQELLASIFLAEDNKQTFLLLKHVKTFYSQIPNLATGLEPLKKAYESSLDFREILRALYAIEARKEQTNYFLKNNGRRLEGDKTPFSNCLIPYNYSFLGTSSSCPSFLG